MYRGLHHFLKKKHKQNKSNVLEKRMDALVYLATPVTIMIFVPQLLKIWNERNANGLSVVTWGGMLGASFFWLVYGIIHKEKPMIILNIAVGTIQLLIVFGILIYQ